jgi:hypothetical protein
MPNEFLTNAQQRQYGRFDGEPNETQLTRYFHLDNTDIGLSITAAGTKIVWDLLCSSPQSAFWGRSCLISRRVKIPVTPDEADVIDAGDRVYGSSGSSRFFP